MANKPDWVQDPKNPNRYTFTDSDGSVYESVKDTPKADSQLSWVEDKSTPGRYTLTDKDGSVYENMPVKPQNKAVQTQDDVPLMSGPQEARPASTDRFSEDIQGQGGWGLSDETKNTLQGQVLPGIKASDVADVAFRGLQAAGAVGHVAADAVDDLADRTGIADALSYDGNKFHPGEAALALGEAFPAGGLEVGMTPHLPQGPVVPTVSKEAEQAFQGTVRDMIKNGASKADLNKFAEDNGRTSFGPELDDVLKARETGKPWDVTSYRTKSEEALARKAATQPDPKAYLGGLGKDSAILDKAPFTDMKTRKANAEAQRVSDITDRIDTITKGWKNSPDFEVVHSVDDIADESVRKAVKAEGADDDALGFLGPDGKVRIIAKNIEEPSELPAVVYHEALGHFGLAQKFGDNLEHMLGEFYDRNVGNFKGAVDDWLKANPDGYKTDPARNLRAAEEVLAQWSEKGALPAEMKDRITNQIKTYGRTIGLDLGYSDREIKTILGMANDAVINGKPSALANGFRYARVWHGTPHEFDEFDHSKMGSGEGAQVYGWGTYLTETRGVAEGYRKVLSRKQSMSQMPADGWRLRDSSVNELKKTYNLSNEDADYLREIQKSPDALARVENKIEWANRKLIKLDQATKDAEETFKNRKGILGGESKRAYKAAKKEFEDHAKSVTSLYQFRDRLTGEPKKGALYEVDIPDDGWMHWDKPIGEQPEVVKALEKNGHKVLNEAGQQAYDEKMEKVFQHYSDTVREKGVRSKEAETARDEYDQMLQDSRDIISGERKAGSVIQELEWSSSPRAVSEMLNKEGIRGTKYLDGMSRNKGEGSYNYVVFNEKDAPIVNRYMRRRKKSTDHPEDEPTGPMMSGNINLDRLDTSKDVSQILDDLAKDTPQETKTWSEVKREARDLGLSASKIAKDSKGVGNVSAKITAYRQVQTEVLDDVAKINEKLQAGYNPKDHADFLKKMAQLSAVHARVSNDTAEVGRALNALKIIAQSKQRSDDIFKALKEAGGSLHDLSNPDVFMRFAKQVQQLQQTGNPNGAANLMTKVLKPYPEDYLLSMRHNMMLSGIGTHYKNAADNLNMLGREYMEAGLAMMGGNVTPQEMAGRTYGIIRAALDATTWRNTWQAFKDGSGTTALNSKVDLAPARIPVLSKVGDALHASDTFFRSFLENSNMYALGMREAKKQGFKGQQMFEEGSRIAQNPTPEMIEAAQKMSDITLLVSKPSPFGQGLEAIKARKLDMTVGQRTGRFLAHLMFPFLRTTENVLWQRIRRSPLSFMDGETRKDFAAGGARRDIAIARTVFGTAVIGYYWQQAREGNVTGSDMPFQKQRSMEPGGYRQNSEVTDDAYTDATALGTSFPNPFGLDNQQATQIAGMASSFYKGKNKDSEYEAFKSATQSFIKSMSEASFAQSLQPWIDAVNAGNDPNGVGKVASLMGGQASTFTPSMARQLNNVYGDTKKRDYSGDRSFEDRVKGRIESNIPGLSDNYPLRYDVYGQEVNKGAGISGVGSTAKKTTDPTVKEMIRVESTLEDRSVVTPAKRSFSFEGKKVSLVKEDYAEFQRTQGYYLREIMAQAIKSPNYKTLTDRDKRDVLREAQKEATKAAKEYIVPKLGPESFSDPDAQK